MALAPQARTAFDRLIHSAQKEDWRGWDPSDALASSWVRRLTFSSRLGRIFWIQLVKRSAFNLRPWLQVPKLENAKAIALLRRPCWQRTDEDSALAPLGEQLLERLRTLAIETAGGSAWGYPFDWQSRAFYAPQQTPNVIVTTFAGHAFLDGFEHTRAPSYAAAAVSACHFILGGLQRFETSEGWCFSYTPLDRSRIHNANLLAASLLCRTGALTQNQRFVEAGLCAASYTASKQETDGSWFYGEAGNQRWIDSFHTGFNVLALDRILRVRQNPALRKAFDAGLHFYTGHFFSPDGLPYYFADKTGPIDIHSAAQAVLTFSAVESNVPGLRALAEKVLSWTFRYLYNEGNGHFTFQKGKWLQNSTPFLRWSDAWMARSLASYLAKPIKAAYVSHAAS